MHVYIVAYQGQGKPSAVSTDNPYKGYFPTKALAQEELKRLIEKWDPDLQSKARTQYGVRALYVHP